MTVGQPISASLAVALIDSYQRFVSPYKGFVCAYRARHRKRSSCSQFGKRAVERLGLLTGFSLIRRRFAKCHAAKQVLDYQTPRKREESNRVSPQASNCMDMDDSGLLACECLGQLAIEACCAAAS